MRRVITALASAAAFAAALLITAPPATGAPLHAFASVALSPDGARLAAIESDEPPRDGAPVVSRLVIRSTAGGSPTAVALPCKAVPDCEPSSPVWSLDGKHIAFILRAPKTKRRAIESVAADGTQLHARLQFTGSVTSLHALPDGALAMLATPGARKDPGATSAGAPLVGEIGTAPDEQRIAVLDAAGHLQFASPPNLYVYEYDAIPGGGFVGTAADGDGDNNWWIAKLYAFNAGRARVIYTPSSLQQQLAQPRVSPDGTRIAFIGGLMSDFGATGGDVYTVPIAGGTATDNTANADSSALALFWECGARQPQRLAFTVQRGPDMRLERLDPDSTQAPRIERAFPAASVSDIAQSCGGGKTLATVVEDFAHAPEIAVERNDAAFAPVTHANATATAVASATDIAWKSDGFDVDGWLLVPPQPKNAGAKRAMITVVHGGPSSAYVPRFVDRGVVRSLLQHGYVVFEPNPRGSFGHGEAFTLANVKDFGYGDLRDVLAGIDAIEQRAPVDDARLGVMGYSYGGYMTMWTVTQTDRFKAAVAGAGVSDWESYYGENGIDRWMIPFFGASVYDDPAVYAKSSPIAFIKRVRTPTFEFVGSDDVECPAPQTQEFWHALQSLGVATQFVIYPGEGHGLRGPHGAADRADAERRTLRWFDRYLR